MSSEPPTPPKPIGPGNHLKAWNDPPLFSVDVNTNATRVTRNKLTARVGYSINGPTDCVLNSSQKSSNPFQSSLPPPLLGPPPQISTFVPQQQTQINNSVVSPAVDSSELAKIDNNSSS